jgi:hypothetical protein
VAPSVVSVMMWNVLRIAGVRRASARLWALAHPDMMASIPLGYTPERQFGETLNHILFRLVSGT